MKTSKVIITTFLIVFVYNTIFAQAKNKSIIPVKDSTEAILKDIKTPQKSSTRGSVIVDGKKINYEATAGTY